MAEEQPLKRRQEPAPTRVPLRGPNVTSTFERPPHPDAQKAHDAVIRRHLRKPPASKGPGGTGPPVGPERA